MRAVTIPASLALATLAAAQSVVYGDTIRIWRSDV
jgi:hypothetical protein